MPSTICIATRASPLALWQAHHVRAQLEGLHGAQLEVELLALTTQGDRLLDRTLAAVGGKGLFVKELEQALLEGRADIAVHSMKDVPVDFPPGLGLTAICQREDPRDALVSLQATALEALPAGARVGTASLRRRAQLLARFPRLEVLELRGNVNTRLARLDRGEFDAIILAAAGLERLGLEQRIAARLDPDGSLPAAGQGALGIECRLADARTRALVAPLAHPETEACVGAERAFNRRLQGGCQVPVAAYAQRVGADGLWLRGLVSSGDGSRVLRGERRGPLTAGEALGTGLADELLARGAGELLTPWR